MVAPIKDPKLTTEIDLEFQRSCNCTCCPSYYRSRTESPDKPVQLIGRTWSLWTSRSEKKLPVVPPNTPVDKK